MTAIATNARPSPHVGVAHQRRRSRLRPGGWLYAGVTVLVAIGAVNGQNNLLFIVLGLLVGCVLASGIVGGGGLMGLRLAREALGAPRVGLPHRMIYHVANANRLLPACALYVEERWDDRSVASGSAFAEVVRSGRAVRSTSAVVFPGRGRYRSDGLVLRSRFPLGLTDKVLEFALPTTLIVLPAPVTLSSAVQQFLAGGGGMLAKRASVGSDGDFVGIREYAPGDPTRLIAWRPSARLGTPVVRLQARGRSTTIWIELDPDDVQAGASLERSVSVAAEVARLLVGDGRSVGLTARGLRVSPGTGPHQAARVRSALATWDASAGGDLPGVPKWADVVRVGPGGLDPDRPATFAAPGVLPEPLGFGGAR